MKYRQLLRQAAIHLQHNPGYLAKTATVAVFSTGGLWMQHRLSELRNVETATNNAIRFNFYGLIKYGICMSAFVCSLFVLAKVSITLLPLAIIVFYIFEVQFLFLFPLLIDGAGTPIRESLKLTYKVGVTNAVATVLPIGLFMVYGLLNLREPFKNWHIGCMAVLIWYNNEVGNRI